LGEIKSHEKCQYNGDHENGVQGIRYLYFNVCDTC
jgi:hypothetical protein